MGRFTLVHAVAGSTKNETQFTKIVGKGFNCFSIVYVRPSEFERVQRFLGGAAPLAHPGDRIVKMVDQPNRSSSIVEYDSASLLVLNEWFTPAWKAQANGRNQPVLRVNQWQTGMLLGAGKNRVEFEYRPTLFRVLIIFNRVTMVLLVSFLILLLYRNCMATTCNPIPL